MKTTFYRIFTSMIILCIILPATANNIKVSHVRLTGKSILDGYSMVQFDLTWENSWRTDDLNGDGVTNWDAAWVFVKYRINIANGGDGLWKHAWLHDGGHSGGTGTASTIVTGLQTPGIPFNANTNPGIGAFIFRSGDGAGTFSATGIKLRWNYGSNGVSDNAVLDIQVFALEMVYVPQGAFAAGSGGSEDNAFTLTTINTSDATTIPTGTDGFYGSAQGGYPTGQTAPANASWPNGYDAFCCMKYEISQQQYVDFLNMLTQTQANNRMFTSSSYRYAITGNTVGSYATSNPYVACNYLSWMDGAAYADWAGLRPMTELEFEKACRGTAAPVPNEYAWGTATIASSAYTLSNAGAANEGIATNYSTTAGNASYSTTDGSIDGPLRVGIFAGHASNTGRVTAGASYYGIMELSGNLWERPVTMSNSTGLAFTGVHGDGALNANGHATESAWPGLTGTPSEITDATGSCFRGGDWVNDDTEVRVSDRRYAATTRTNRDTNGGFRAVRTPGKPPGQPSAISGPVDPCGIYSGIVYSVTSEPNVTYTWSVPTGWSITGGQNTHEITVRAGTAAGNIEVIPSNVWGTGPDQTLAVTTQVCYPAGTVHCDPANPTAIVDVTNPSTGRTWMDRNLGASQVATSSTDALAYGDLYQWGRLADGHQCRNSGITETRSSTDQPGHGDFTKTLNYPYNWRNPQNTSLWQGVSGINNPCPSGYRLPTNAELDAERASWSPLNATGALASPLKLPLAGARHYWDGSLFGIGSNGWYWSSTVSTTNSRHLYILTGNAIMSTYYRTYGLSIRCIKDY